MTENRNLIRWPMTERHKRNMALMLVDTLKNYWRVADLKQVCVMIIILTLSNIKLSNTCLSDMEYFIRLNF